MALISALVFGERISSVCLAIFLIISVIVMMGELFEFAEKMILRYVNVKKEKEVYPEIVDIERIKRGLEAEKRRLRI